MSRKKDRPDLKLFIPFYWFMIYPFDDKTSLEYICKGFQIFFCYILGVKVTDLESLTVNNVYVFSATLKIVVRDYFLMR